LRSAPLPAGARGHQGSERNTPLQLGEDALAVADKPLDVAADLQAEIEDVCDALATIGISSVSVAESA
jgi:hypothetical protein